MFINIGNEVVLNTKDIITIIEANELNLKKNKMFFQKINISNYDNIIKNDIRSFIITNSKIYCSPISTFTLLNRTNKY